MTERRAHIDQIVPGILALIFVLATIVGVFLFVGPVRAQEAPAPELEVPVAGIQCVGCRPVVTEALSGVEGVASAAFCCDEDNVRIGATEEGVRLSALNEALEEASGQLEQEMPGAAFSIDEEVLYLTTFQLVIEPVHCEGCVGRVLSALQDDDAVGPALATVTRQVNGSEGRLCIELAEPLALTTLRAAFPDHPEVTDVILAGAVCSSEATDDGCDGCGGGCEEAPAEPSDDASDASDEEPVRKRPPSCGG